MGRAHLMAGTRPPCRKEPPLANRRRWHPPAAVGRRPRPCQRHRPPEPRRVRRVHPRRPSACASSGCRGPSTGCRTVPGARSSPEPRAGSTRLSSSSTKNPEYTLRRRVVQRHDKVPHRVLHPAVRRTVLMRQQTGIGVRSRLFRCLPFVRPLPPARPPAAGSSSTCATVRRCASPGGASGSGCSPRIRRTGRRSCRRRAGAFPAACRPRDLRRAPRRPSPTTPGTAPRRHREPRPTSQSRSFACQMSTMQTAFGTVRDGVPDHTARVIN